MVFVEVLIVLATVLYLLYRYGTETYKHWEKKGVKYIKPSAPFVGNSENMVFKKETSLEYLNRIYYSFPKERFGGFFIFRQPALLIRDPELIKKVMIKDFDHFVNRYTINVFISPEADSLLEKSLVSIKDKQWRDMRNALSPAFTSSKLKFMLELMNKYEEQMTNHLDEMSKRQVKENHPDGGMLTFEFKEFFRRFTNDAIATCAFGVDVDSFKDLENEFFKSGERAQDYNIVIQTKLVLYMLIPALMKALKISLFDDSIHSFFKNLIDDNLKIRREQDIVRPDLLHLLMQAQKQKLAKGEGNVTDENITAESLLFFFAAFEVSATTLSFTAHELAVNPDVQKRLQEEIDQVIEEDNGITYEGVMQKMKYLDMVINESLRMWPPGPVADRIVNTPYVIPKTENSPEVILDKNDVVWVPIAAIHRNPEYHPNPNKFDPERFSDENKDKMKHYTYMPFGIGPRSCISMRFGLLEVKACLVYLLQKYSFVVIPKTQVPIQLQKGLFTMTPERGFWLGLKPRNDKRFC